LSKEGETFAGRAVLIPGGIGKKSMFDFFFGPRTWGIRPSGINVYRFGMMFIDRSLGNGRSNGLRFNGLRSNGLRSKGLRPKKHFLIK